jgi:hypothetical protein
MRIVTLLSWLVAGCATAGSEPATADAALSEEDAPITDEPDAAAAAPDARPAADARPPGDARPPADARVADAGCVIELLGNGGFDQTTGTGAGKQTDPWSTLLLAGDPAYVISASDELLAATGVSPKDGPYAARFGGASGVKDAIFQAVEIPAAAISLTLSGWIWVRSGVVMTKNDVLTIALLDEQGGPVETLGTVTEAEHGGGYVMRSFKAATPHAGAKLTLQLSVVTDYATITDFFVDSLGLQARVCP